MAINAATRQPNGLRSRSAEQISPPPCQQTPEGNNSDLAFSPTDSAIQRILRRDLSLDILPRISRRSFTFSQINLHNSDPAAHQDPDQMPTRTLQSRQVTVVQVHRLEMTAELNTTEAVIRDAWCANTGTVRPTANRLIEVQVETSFQAATTERVEMVGRWVQRQSGLSGSGQLFLGKAPPRHHLHHSGVRQDTAHRRQLGPHHCRAAQMPGIGEIAEISTDLFVQINGLYYTSDRLRHQAHRKDLRNISLSRQSRSVGERPISKLVSVSFPRKAEERPLMVYFGGETSGMFEHAPQTQVQDKRTAQQLLTEPRESVSEVKRGDLEEVAVKEIQLIPLLEEQKYVVATTNQRSLTKATPVQQVALASGRGQSRAEIRPLETQFINKIKELADSAKVAAAAKTLDQAKAQQAFTPSTEKAKPLSPFPSEAEASDGKIPPPLKALQNQEPILAFGRPSTGTPTAIEHFTEDWRVLAASNREDALNEAVIQAIAEVVGADEERKKALEIAQQQQAALWLIQKQASENKNRPKREEPVEEDLLSPIRPVGSVRR